MASTPASAATAFVTVLLFAIALPAQTTDAASPSSGVSKIRVVRLSEVKGTVRLDRDIGRGFEPAMANMPIVEKSRLRTDEGVAEVEFEDNSTLRLAPNSVVEFPQLERLATGATASSVHLLRGTAYVSLVKTKNNEFNLLFGQEKLEMPPGSHIRLDDDEVQANLAVLDGTVQVDGPSGAVDVSRKKSATFHLVDQTQPEVGKDIAAEPYDSWDQNASGYHARTAAYSALSSSPYSYALNDMMYYGSFMDAAGCGSMWRPYFASAAWDPYSNGAWAFYSGAGYSWVSPYPWGWTPYHYGSWSLCPGAGWGWQPGGAWSGLNNATALLGGGTRGSFPVAPVHPPRPGEPSLMPVNLKPLVHSEVASADSFVFRKDSAGLGIPRDGLGKLDKLSRQALDRGTASTHIYVSVPTSAMNNVRGMSAGGLAPSAVHRGSAPAVSEPTAALSQANSSSGARSNSGMSAASPSSSHAGAAASGGRPR